ncbi:hypothetical protein AA637_13250 [Cyanobacterium sp. HL-69]|uniref:hypothetical protein n=1 Tax=Cyanobacterium sp. HL-69 TaxID=2054282 RepID=UPI000CA20573|nr:hypothetical protein AA637_13250 [Cyanobacterium sp. HL-69]
MKENFKDSEIKHFIKLKKKYKAQAHKSESLSSPLYPILIKIDSDEKLTRKNHHQNTTDVEAIDEIQWLEDHRLYETLVIYYEKLYEKTKKTWIITQICGCLRKLGNPEEVLKLTDEFLKKKVYADARVKSAILTTRGGAFLDLGNLSMAEQCGLEAMKLYESYQAHFFLSNVYAKKKSEQDKSEENFIKSEEHFKRGTEIKDRIDRRRKK